MKQCILEDKYFGEFKRLTLAKLGEDNYLKMTEEDLFASFTALITLVGTIKDVVR